jgi:signal transduction histidine kinase
LGNKESDWIKLQQFRTKGQQWYRFDLGNTVGYVALSDAGQKHIQEISSRLDISENETSEAFKLLINVVFNYLFYILNRKANDLMKTLLAEEGLLEENLSKRVKKNDAALREMMKRNKRIRKNLLTTVKKEKIEIICNADDLTWFVPKGVLLHVFYNLINNSLYWIDIRRKRAQSDRSYAHSGPDAIMIEEYGVDGIVVYDTGTGVSKSMEDILFEPLQSGKPLSEGRGMGLYIVRKLLESFGGEIELLDERNEYGNRYKFLLVSNTSEEL